MKRVYRHIESSDLPKIQAGKLKCVVINSKTGKTYPARLISNQFGSANVIAFLYSHDGHDYLITSLSSGILQVDITPEKRYTIWNKQRGRFALMGGTDIPVFSNKIEAESCITEVVRSFALKDGSNFAVVEFDYPGE